MAQKTGRTLVGAQLDENILEPIAIVGISLRFPEDAVSEETFWDMLLKQRCASTRYPKDRINIDGFYSSDPAKDNTMSSNRANFLSEDFRVFDAPFFSIPPSEAATMDPLQRGVLETTYRALENAGIPLETIKGSKTSVHVGSFTDDFNTMSWRDTQQIPKYSATGTSVAILSNRISWFFDLRGPSMSVDTACSSGLVALHLSCSDLWAGESSMGIVAGSNLILSPELNIAMSNMSFLSKDGKCYSFDKRANGYSRGEGFGVLILKRLSHAIRNGDTIRALVRSTGVNQDGYTGGGVTQPSKTSQTDLIFDTYRKAGLDMSLTRFVEAHGTGTAIGDPIEARAIGESFYGHRSPSDPLIMGAVKPNIGHLEGASGIASIIKTIMVLEKATIPPNTNFESLNPKIDSEFFNLKFPLSCLPWPTQGPRRASVNSFGFGGTNAHAVIDDAYHYLHTRGLAGNHSTIESPPSQEMLAPPTGDKPYSNGLLEIEESPQLLIWSAADEQGTHRLAQAYSKYFVTKGKRHNVDILPDVVFSLNTRRTSLPWKAFVVVNSVKDLENLEELMVRELVASSTSKQNLGFIFTGQGAQWHGMGRELMAYPTFNNSIVQADETVKGLGCKWSIIEELTKDDTSSRVNEPEFSQTISTAVQVGLVDLFRALDVIPATVVGHSSGEIAAAYCIGALSLQSTMRVAYYRGMLASKLMQTASSKYSMVSVGLSEEQTQLQMNKLALLGAFDPKKMSISCINSPKSVTLAGPEDQIDILTTHLEKENIFGRKLKVNVGYHSPQMQEIASQYLDKLHNLWPGSNWVDTYMVSSVTGEIIPADILRTGQYWVRNMVSPVNFLGALMRSYNGSKKAQVTRKLDRSHLNRHFTHTWLEVGPHAALQGPLRDTLSALKKTGEVSYNSALIRNRSSTATFLNAVGWLYCKGHRINMSKLFLLTSKSQKKPKVLVDLPQYPFNHSVLYWEESRLNREFRFRQHTNHDLLGSRVQDWNSSEPRWTRVFRLDEVPWAEDHKIDGSILYPAAGMLAMALEATSQLLEMESRPVVGYEIKEAVFQAPLILSTTNDGTEMQICLHPRNESVTSWYGYRIYSYKAEEGWYEISHGEIRADFGLSKSEVDEGQETAQHLDLYQKALASCNGSVEAKKLYQELKNIGLDYGPSFQGLEQIRFNDDGEATATVSLSKWARGDEHNLSSTQCSIVHPATLDTMFQLVFIALSKANFAGMQTMVPTRIARLWISRTGAGPPFLGSVQAHAYAQKTSKRSASASISVVAEHDRQLKIGVEGLVVTAISSTDAASKTEIEQKQLCYHMKWKPDLDTMDEMQILQYCRDQPPTDDGQQSIDTKLVALAFAAAALKELRDHDQQTPLRLVKFASWVQTQFDIDMAQTPAAFRKSRKAWIDDPDNLSYLFDTEHTAKTGKDKLLMKIGSRLPRVVLGEVKLLDLLHEDDSLLGEYIREEIESSRSFKELSCYLEALIHKHPGMNILEIGAGSGTYTRILRKTMVPQPASPLYTSYEFTELDKNLLEQAKATFHQETNMKFHVLDIEKSPSSQSFKDGSYDIVILTTFKPGSEQGLQNARGLLKPGGKLVIIEKLSEDNLVKRLVASLPGLIPEWWDTSHQLAQRPYQWESVLTSNGFSGIDLVFSEPSEETHGQRVLISTAREEVSSPLHYSKTVVILEKDSELQIQLADNLKHELQRLGISIFEFLTLKEATASTTIQGCHFILLSELESPILLNMSAEQLDALKMIVQAARGVLWVTRGGGRDKSPPDYDLVKGLFRVIRQEHPTISLVTLALDPTVDNHPRTIAKVSHDLRIKSEIVEPEYVEKDGYLHIGRVVQAPLVNEHIFRTTNYPLRLQGFGEGVPLKISVRTPGLLDSIEFHEDNEPREPLGSDQVEIQVQAVGVNFKECLTVLGRIDTDRMPGECAGIISRVGKDCKDLQIGDRVAIYTMDTYRSYARANAKWVVKIPDSMSFAQAASIPIAFGTAYYSLVQVARLQKGETILIHAAAGGTGQAAVQYALYLGAEIFATVGSMAKKRLLMEMYKIPEDHIFYSRDISFADGIKRITKSRGVDVVLNSLSGEALVATWECIAPYGRFVEIGRKDIDSHGNLPMFPFARNTSFTGVDLVSVILDRPALAQNMMQEIMQLLSVEQFRTIYPLTVYSISDLEQAFRSLQSGKSSGKLVVEITKEAMVPTCLKAEYSTTLDENATYLIAGGLGGIGRSISRWLVDRGARNLLLLSRSGGEKSAQAQALLAELRSNGVHVEAPVCDITDLPSLRNVLERYKGIMPAVKGSIQASMVLRDTTFAKISFKDWEESLKPKVQGSWNLHNALPKGMDFFILLSSASGIFGNPGQSNYAAGNTYQDGLANYRCSLGENATSLDLGLVLSEGVVAENSKIMDHLMRREMFLPLTQEDVLALLDFHTSQPSVNTKSQVVTGLDLPAKILARGGEIHSSMYQPLFRHMHQIKYSGYSQVRNTEQALDYKSLFVAATSLEEAAHIAAEGLRQKLSKMLGIAEENIELSHRVESYGVDSLVAVELRNWLAKEMGADLAVFEIVGGATLTGVGQTVAGKSQFLMIK
ncbi:reducing type I polyketide synthase [Rhexocercosporidium sp. MPI-PUGE-AT-0058]|nr:reducing type I polyketide synthase [Rhexocercosporidium sp. MPI-PUGE-AT-0058]